jgi:thymidylate synthase
MNYKEIIENVLKNGTQKQATRLDSNGKVIPVENGTIGTFCEIFRHNMADGFPLTTLRKMPWQSIRVELEGFIKGITDKKWYQDRKCKFWSEWSNPLGCPSWFTKEQQKEHQLKDTDLGNIYGAQWRGFNLKNKPTPRNLDNLDPTVAGVGVISHSSEDEIDNLVKKTWYSMLHRCYNEKDKDYSAYGEKGIYVVNRWLTYEYFKEDVQKITGWTNKILKPLEFTLDKDSLGFNCYGPNSCIWASKKEQANNKTSVKRVFGKNSDGLTFSCDSIKEFAETYNLKTYGISHCLSGKQSNHRGWTFWQEDNEKEIYVDQLKSIVEKLKTNPYDRRMVCSAWNPNQEHLMALPSCHVLWNVVVYGNKLNLVWFQRSVDSSHGLPANIASYALLLMLLCKESGLEPGELVGTLSDCHLYNNTLDAVTAMVERSEKPLPTLNIKSKEDGSFSIFDWNWNEVGLIGYDPHPAIEMGKVTV